MKSIKEWKQRIALAWTILRHKDGNLVGHAKRELKGSYESGSEMDAQMAVHLINMVRLFSAEGHSGFSASYAASALNELLRFKPLGPITGNDDEWVEVGRQNGKPLYQNNRCSGVFKVGDRAYDVNGIVFREPNGSCYSNRSSRVPVTFPYTPKTITVDVPENATHEQERVLVENALKAL